MNAPLAATPRVAQFAGYFDSLDGRELRGWACNLTSPREPVKLHVLLDEQEIGTVICDQLRQDVQASIGVMTPRLGFAFTLPDSVVDGLEHRLGLRFPDRSIVPSLAANDGQIRHEDIVFMLAPRFRFDSFVDGFRAGALRGWVQRVDPASGARLGACDVAIHIDGAPFKQIRADRFRGDVAAAIGGDPNCGFEVAIPRNQRRAGAHRFSFHVIPENVELSGSPVVTSVVDDQLEARLLLLGETVDRLHREISALRTQIADLTPKARHTLGDYDVWAREYFDSLRARVAERRAASGGGADGQPLVSVICPTYKPDMEHFIAAVESVIAQTWTNWELIVVDDGGKSLEVAARLAEYCRADPRIKLLRLRKNVGIAGATNAGIAAAKGKWIAFFDHDDLLVDVALERMFQAAHGLEAKIIYSDEDKIDDAGVFQEPNFKPDFDYRYLLGCNYICHLTLVRADVLREAGDLRAQYDGAQDHDLMLRLTEIVPRDEILHVPEVLYHWRKTPNSTATTVANKQYAVKAGVQAVADHLKRVGHTAEVKALNDITIYDVRWSLQRTPDVTIIIPFKDQIDTTRECVARLLENTDYKHFNIVLVDNWSATQEAADFCQEIVRDKRVSVMPVREEFNYSRLNNLAAAKSQSEFFFFMNNDLFMHDPQWLQIVLSEALAADDIGAVGGKFLYPSGAVQHVGVAVGPNGVATHVHRGLPGNDYGYIGRAVLSHETTAVTAAGMLVRAEAFREVDGFDEVNLKVAYNDVDFCLKLRDAGWRIIQCNDFVAVHHEGLSRGSDDRPEHEARFQEETRHMHVKWGDNPLYLRDPAYSPHFRLEQSYYDLARPGGAD